MVDFGKRPGDMLKEDYDTDDSGVVDEVEALPDHAGEHEDAGDDEISVAALSGELADAQPVKAHDLSGGRHNASILANLNLLISDATLDKDTDTRTPAAHKTSHQDAGTDEVDATGLVGRINYVDRGEVSGWDKDTDDFTTDGGTYEMDLSAIVPAGAVAMRLLLYIVDDTVGAAATVSQNGFSNWTNALRAEVKLAMISTDVFGIIPCAADRKIQYKTSNLTISSIYLLVVGWFI